MSNKGSSKRIDKPLITSMLMAMVLNIYRSNLHSHVLKSTFSNFLKYLKYLTFSFIVFSLLERNSILNKNNTQIISKKLIKEFHHSFLLRRIACPMWMFLEKFYRLSDMFLRTHLQRRTTVNLFLYRNLCAD